MASPSSSRRQHAVGWSPRRGNSWRRRRRRKVVERTPTSSKSRGKMVTTTSSRHPERVRSRKPRDAPRDPHAALRDLEILAIVDDDDKVVVVPWTCTRCSTRRAKERPSSYALVRVIFSGELSRRIQKELLPKRFIYGVEEGNVDAFGRKTTTTKKKKKKKIQK